jgi:hypothetical protein
MQHDVSTSGASIAIAHAARVFAVRIARSPQHPTPL